MIEVPEFKFALREDLKNQEGFLPTKSEPSATGWDVRCAESYGITIGEFKYVRISLGFRVFAPHGWWLELRPRSSIHAKKHLNCLYGVIDEGFENICQFSCSFLPEPDEYTGYWVNDVKSIRIEFGERIGQIIPVRRQNMIVSNISNEEYDRLCKERGGERGTGGFGSTG